MQQIATQTNGAVIGSLSRDLSKLIIWEAGHFYHAKGPTMWSQAGWSVMAALSHEKDKRMLFIDDVHPIENVHETERSLERIAFDPKPPPTHIAAESRMLPFAQEALEVLKSRSMPKRYRARQVSGTWRCSGYPLQAANGRPLCLFLDLGLTWYKRSLGFNRAVNIVPAFYADEQRRLVRLVEHAMPDFELRVIIHDVHGRWRYLEEVGN